MAQAESLLAWVDFCQSGAHKPSQVGIAGCCNIGNDVTIWGQVGVSSDITVEDGVVILATSGVSKDLKKGKTYFGAPAEEAKEYYKKQVKISRLIQG